MELNCKDNARCSSVLYKGQHVRVISHGDILFVRLHIQHTICGAAGYITISSLGISVAISQLFRNCCQMPSVLRVVVRDNTVGRSLPTIGNHDYGSRIPFHYCSGHAKAHGSCFVFVFRRTSNDHGPHLVGLVLESTVESASHCPFVARTINCSSELDRSKACLVLFYSAPTRWAAEACLWWRDNIIINNNDCQWREW